MCLFVVILLWKLIQNHLVFITQDNARIWGKMSKSPSCKLSIDNSKKKSLQEMLSMRCDTNEIKLWKFVLKAFLGNTLVPILIARCDY